LAPVSISYIYTDADKQSLNMVCNNNGCKSDQGNQLVLEMVDEAGKVVLHKKVPVMSDNLIFTIPFSIASLQPGLYKFTMTGVDKNGKTFFSNYEMYHKPRSKPQWSNTESGLSNKVPAPWTPIEATDKQFKCWGREYSFNNSCLLSSIISQDIELLAKPIRLTVNDQQASNSSCQLIIADNVMAQYQLMSQTADVDIKADVKVEFDGFAWIDLAITPKSNSTTVNTMFLDIPLIRKYITSFDNCQSLRGKYELTGSFNQKISNNFAKMPACWIGSEDVGLMIGAKNIKGWYVKNKNQCMEIIPEDKTITMRLNLVDTPLKMTTSRRISFYLDATPTKPKNKKVKAYRNLENVNMWSGYWSAYYEYHKPAYLDWSKLKKMSTNKQEKFHYTATHGVSPYSPEWNYYGKEWHSAPPALGAYCVDTDVSNRKLRNRNTFTYGCLDCKSFFDFKLHNLADLINHQDAGISNLYTDLAWPKLCGNKTHGCGWIDEFGDKHSSLDVIGTREYYKRLYKVLRDKNPDAVIATHLVRTRTPADSFTDIICFGEAYDHAVAQKESYFGVLTPQEVRIAYVSRAKEQEIWLIPQFSRALILFKPQRMASWKAGQKDADLAIKHFLGYMTVHDISFWNDNDVKKRAKQLYVAQDWLGWGDNKTQFYPYWKQANQPVKLTKNSESDRVMVSTFVRNGKALIAILNDADKTEELVLKIDSKKLFDKDNVNITGKDAFNHDNYYIKNNTLNVQMKPRDFKLLMCE
jgi:hypothetical protein